MFFLFLCYPSYLKHRAKKEPTAHIVYEGLTPFISLGRAKGRK